MPAPFSVAVVRHTDGLLLKPAPPQIPEAAREAVGVGTDAFLLLPPGQTQRGFLAGTLSSFTLPELFGQLVSGVRTGRLVVESGAVRKSVSLVDGQITFASSTDPDERLGTVLVRLGMLTEGALQAALTQVKPGTKLGQALVSTGAVTAAQLYSAMTYLVREITLGLFSISDGTFVFLDGAVEGEDALKLPERTRDLVLAGIARGEELGRLRRKYPPELELIRGGIPVPAEHELLLALAFEDAREEQGGAETEGATTSPRITVDALRSHVEETEHSFLTLIDALVQGEVLVRAPTRTVARATAAAGGSSRGPLDIYAQLVSAICAALVEEDQDLDLLRAFFADPPVVMKPLFEGVALDVNGRLDVDRVLANAGPGGKGRVRALEALNAFVSFAVFTAKNALSPASAQALDAKVAALKEGRNG